MPPYIITTTIVIAVHHDELSTCRAGLVSPEQAPYMDAVCHPRSQASLHMLHELVPF